MFSNASSFALLRLSVCSEGWQGLCECVCCGHLFSELGEMRASKGDARAAAGRERVTPRPFPESPFTEL